MLTFWLCSACLAIGAIIGDLIASLCGYGIWSINLDVFSDLMATASGNQPGIGEIIGCIILLLVFLAIIGLAGILLIGGIVHVAPKSAWFIPIGAIIAFVSEAFPTEFALWFTIIGGIIIGVSIMFGSEIIGFIDNWGFLHIFKK